jgi:hypothetical protein
VSHPNTPVGFYRDLSRQENGETEVRQTTDVFQAIPLLVFQENSAHQSCSSRTLPRRTRGERADPSSINPTSDV